MTHQPPAMDADIRVMLVEDDPATSARLTSALASVPGIHVMATCQNRVSACEWLTVNTPDVVLCDLGLPDGSGIDVIRFARRRHPHCECMVITMFGDEANVLASISAGATGYLLKDASDEDLRASVRELRAGGSPMSPVIARRVINRLRDANIPAPRAVRAEPATPLLPEAVVALSARESEILDLVARGYTYAEIARHLSISVNTVAAHIRNIYGKLAVNSRSEAVFEAHKLGLLKSM
ncbi:MULTISPECIES: response regulator transcription factor [Cupriavidus]|jgi:DNA-binding NarL/FixJ family response regulator|uniref:Two component transcriptional regulator, LuxR family n=2 Tax=Cupriavidus metallidurans TaxID=119219 RepID=Q1LDC8_CUPMC|nr:MULTISPECIES: response regulator transcription factor [Cupriavidus]ABF11848.1 two component transcriptional regulator, LuxR family [Cupriavidus metallidurans CH34]KWR81602.1 LuxR family transcriptional regulator [Cupriavidus sp. SHE]KWW35029.1 Oxygen regulatory protein NreC [Cupriavidus metallidurans]QBP12922.1 response regulator transcription factor [Cupriavidus metallidurans]QGS32865.1 response regulator [Cupriavidus metallidurans]